MNRLTEKQLLIITIGITVLLTGGLGFLIWSDLKTVEEEEKKTSDLKVQIDAAEAEIAKIPEREFRVIANREISDREVAFMPEETEIENFWEVLERFAVESGVRISEIVPNAVRTRGRRGAKKSSIDSVPQIMSLKATVGEFLAFINLIENYERIINVMEYSLTGGEAPDEDGKVRHSIKLALTTFTYSKKIASTIVSINNYEKKKEHAKVKQWLSRIKIQEKETYTLRTSLGRRDPFVSARKPVLPVDPEAASNSEEQRQRQEQMLEQLVSLVEALADGLDYQEELQKRGDLWRLQAQIKENKETLTELRQLIDTAKKQINLPELADRLRKEVIDPFERLKKRMGDLVDQNPPMPMEHVKEWRQKVAALYDEKKWKDVEGQVREFLERSKDGKHVAEASRELVIEILEYRRSAKVIQAFTKRRIVITTIIHSENGNSVVVINRKLYSEGDALDSAGEIIVVEIGESFVIFETEGVEIKKDRD